MNKNKLKFLNKYSRNLANCKWFKKRKEILIRDHHQCVKCGSTKNLHVHHKEYRPGYDPWEYPDSFYETLCSICHEKFHGRSFSRNRKNGLSKSEKKKIKKTNQALRILHINRKKLDDEFKNIVTPQP